jgi:hypothetical protein
MAALDLIIKRRNKNDDGFEELRVDLLPGQVLAMDENDNPISLDINSLISTAVNPTPFNAGNITGATDLDRAAGSKQTAAATGNVTLNVISGVDFDSLDLFLTASGADRTINVDASVKIPSDTGLTLPSTITSGKGCRVRFEKHGADWCLVSLVKSY